jgi:conjugal transfer/entry exclusion protein
VIGSEQANLALEKTDRENTSDILTAKKIQEDLSGYKNRMESLADKVKQYQDEKVKIDR